MESWVVENVSWGGFGVVVSDILVDWLKVGVLLVIQFEGGKNWLLGIVCCYCWVIEIDVCVGIEILVLEVDLVELKLWMVLSYVVVVGMLVLLVQEGFELGEVCVVLLLVGFNLQEVLEYIVGGKCYLLMLVIFVEQLVDFMLVCYWLIVIGQVMVLDYWVWIVDFG